MAHENFVSNALTSLGAVDQNAKGKLYIDGQAVNAELSQVIAETIYIKQIFRDGQSVTGKYAAGLRANGLVRVLLDTPLPFAARTLSMAGRAGTTGNDGVINRNGKIMPSTQDFNVVVNQINDQMMIFPEVSKEFIPLDLMARKIAQYAERVQMDRDSSTLAEIIAYNVWRALNDGDNLNTFDKTQDYAYNGLLNDLNTKLDDGDIAGGVYSYRQDGRCIIGRPEFVNGLFGSKAGIVVTGSDKAFDMLKNYSLEGSMNSRKYVGSNYMGNVMGFDIVKAPNAIWSLAEKYLGLAKGALDNITAIAVSSEATAMANNVDLGVKMVDSQDVRGLIAQPLNLWGHEAFRKVQLVGNANLTAANLLTLGFSADERKYPCAPQVANENFDSISVPIFNAAGEIVGYQQVAKVPQPNGGGITTNPLQVATPVINATNKASVTITTTTTGATIKYTTDGTDPLTSDSAETYSAAITTAAGKTVKAIAVKADMINSAVATSKVAS